MLQSFDVATIWESLGLTALVECTWSLGGGKPSTLYICAERTRRTYTSHPPRQSPHDAHLLQRSRRNLGRILPNLCLPHQPHPLVLPTGKDPVRTMV